LHIADNKKREQPSLPAVSVIIPAYNAEHFLQETIESVLKQTYTDFEVIIVDDGSTDGTADKAKSYLHDPRVHYIYQENKGVCAARNKGIRSTKSELIAFVDADDVWLQEKLEKQVPLFEDNNVGLVYCMIEHIDENDNVLPHLSWPHPRGATYKDLLYINWIVGSGSSVIIRKDVFDKVGFFDEGLKGLEDMDMWIRILHGYKSSYVDSVLVKIRRHIKSRQAQKMASKSVNLQKRQDEYFLHVQRSIERFPELEEYRREAYYQIFRGLFYTAYVYAKKKEMLRYYLKAGRYRPSFFIESIITYFRKYILKKGKDIS
jgi:glycosyltransferase involved in cell wall biosynthesis